MALPSPRPIARPAGARAPRLWQLLGARRPVRRLLALLSAAAILVLVAILVIEFRRRADALEQVTLPRVEPRSVFDIFVDTTPVELMMTVGTERVPFFATRDALLSDPTLWRRLQIADWNTIPMPVRPEALDAMLAHYRPLVLDPGAWDRLSAEDWDEVPPAIRALAFRHMAEYWSGFYQVGASFGLPRQLVADTLEAIVMSESWFDHRAVNVARWGNRDLGLAQASDQARERLWDLYAAGLVDVAFADEEYFNPWNATRFAAIWFDLLLDETAGDVNLAIRAYHRGFAAALDAQGDAYLEGVLRRRRRYIRNRGAPPAWSYLWQRDRELQRAAWPWLYRDASAADDEMTRGEPVRQCRDASCSCSSRGLGIPRVLSRAVVRGALVRAWGGLRRLDGPRRVPRQRAGRARPQMGPADYRARLFALRTAGVLPRPALARNGSLPRLA